MYVNFKQGAVEVVDGKLFGVDVSDNSLQFGRIDYFTLFNALVVADKQDYYTLHYPLGISIDNGGYRKINGDAEYVPNAYQKILVDMYIAERLMYYTDELIMYNDELNVYMFCIPDSGNCLYWGAGLSEYEIKE